MKRAKPISIAYIKLSTLFILFFICPIIQAQDTTSAIIERSKDSLIIASREGMYTLTFRGKDLLETRFTTSHNSDSLVVHMGSEEKDLKLNVSKVADSLALSSEGINISINKEPFRIIYNFEQLWVDLNTGKRHLPGSSIFVSREEEIVPELVRSGAIFPVVKEEKYDEPLRYLQLHYVFSSGTKEKQKNTCNDSIVLGSYCYNTLVKAGNNLNITVEREANPLSGSGEEIEMGEVEFIVHIVNRKVEFVWVNGIKYTGKNYMHQGNLVVPLNFRENRAELKVEWD